MSNKDKYKETFDKMFEGTTPKDLDSVLPTRNCMFQYATNFGRWTGSIIHEDTGLLTEEEAIALWDKYKAQARKEVADGYDVDMVIWVGCDSNTDYHTRHEIYNYESVDGGTL